MVVFTCNHCGDSLQKPRVEKHYQTSCRNAISVTCMDCLKDFKFQEYAVHNKCMTEEQRYSAKGTVQGGAKKGEMKQISWVAQINNILETNTKLKPNEKKLLDFVSKNENVPRKKKQFINFMKSSSGNRIHLQDVEAVWDILEAHKNTMASKEDAKKNEVENKNTEVNNLKTNEDEKTSDNVEVIKKTKKKKQKEVTENVEMHEEVKEEKLKKKKRKEVTKNVENTEVAHEEVKEEKLKKKKRKVQAVETIISETEPEVPKKKKKKNKKLQNEETSFNGNDNIEETVETAPKKKKKKSVTVDHTPEVTNTDVTENGKSSKKKRKRNDKLEDTNNMEGEEIKENGTEKKKKKNKENSPVKDNDGSTMNDFSWQKSILEVLHKKKQIPKNKLQKIVFKKFKSIRGETPLRREVQNYHKKLAKLKNVNVENDMVIFK